MFTDFTVLANLSSDKAFQIAVGVLIAESTVLTDESSKKKIECPKKPSRFQAFSLTNSPFGE